MSRSVPGPAQSGLTVVVPCFNEVDNVEPSYQEIVAELGNLPLELLYVDDGSTDGTLDVVRALAHTDPRVRYLSFTRNFGFEAAFSAGYRYAGKPWILHIDADQQFPAAEAEKLITAAEEGNDAVFGVRTNRQDPLLRRWGTAAFHFLGRRVLRIEIPPGATAFRLVRTELARKIVDLHLGTPYFLATVPRLTSRYTTVPVAHRARARGESKVGFGFLSSHAIELFVGFTRRLTTMASTTAMAAAGISALAGIAAATGLLGLNAAATLEFVLFAVLLTVLALSVRYLVVVGAGQARPRQFYIREANFPVDEDDRLYASATAEVHPGERQAGVKKTEETAAPRSLVILGGADGSVSTYHRARELGFRTICVDVRASAPAAALADEFVQVSVRAPEQIAAALDGRDDIAGVLCPASDVGLPALAWLTRHWNLPDPLPEAAVAASVDKSVFRELCDRLRLPTYRSVGGKPGPDLALAAQQLRFPTLVKPVDSSGSRGVVSCASPGGLDTAFTDSLAFSPSGRLVVEEHLDGSHYTIEALVVDGRIVFHAVTRRTLTPPPFFVTASHLLPAGLPPMVDRALPVMLAGLCAELGYRTGPLTLDAVLGRDGKFYLIEMGARMGGNGLAEAIELSTGVDLIAAGIAAATGGEVVLAPRDPRPTLIHILASDRSGRIVRIEGADEVRAMPAVHNLELFAEQDSYVKPYEQAGYKMGYAVLSAPTVPEVLAAEDELRGTLKFLLDEQGMAVPLP